MQNLETGSYKLGDGCKCIIWLFAGSTRSYWSSKNLKRTGLGTANSDLIKCNADIWRQPCPCSTP